MSTVMLIVGAVVLVFVLQAVVRGVIGPKLPTSVDDGPSRDDGDN